MLALVSPAKKLDFSDLKSPLPHSEAAFGEHTLSLVRTARRLSRPKLAKLMNLSGPLTDLNYRRFQDHAETTSLENGKQAALAFAGDTYTGLDAAGLDEGDWAYAQDHLRILSGLYGLLRPLDLIQPYRLEMGSRLATRRGKSLYDFWGERLAGAIDETVADHTAPVVINLASIEYFKAVQGGRLKARAITPLFKEVGANDAGSGKVIGFFAKRARGAMARYMIKQRLEDPQDLKSFTGDGYRYRDNMSDADNWVFTRSAK